MASLVHVLIYVTLCDAGNSSDCFSFPVGIPLSETTTPFKSSTAPVEKKVHEDSAEDQLNVQIQELLALRD